MWAMLLLYGSVYFSSGAVAMMAISKTNFTDVVLRATLRPVIVALQS